MRPNSLIREQGAKLLSIAGAVCVPEIGQHLPDLGAAEQMLLRALEERRQRFLPPDEHAGEAVVEEALVAESVAAPVEGEYALRGQLVHVCRLESVQRFLGNRKLLCNRHLVTEGLHHLHPLIRRCDSCCDRPPLLVPVLLKYFRRRVEAGFEKEGQVLRKPQEFQLAIPEQRRIETRVVQDCFDLAGIELRDFDLRLRIGRHELPQATIVLPVERPTDDDGMNYGLWACPTGFMEQLCDDVECAGVSAGRGAHRVQLIRDQDPRAARGFGCRREYQYGGFFEIEMAPESRGGRCRKKLNAVEAERQHRQAAFAQGLRDLQDAGCLPGAGLAGHDAFGCSGPQPGQQRFRRLSWDEGFPNEPSPCAIQVSIRRFPHGDACMFRAEEAPHPITALGECIDEILTGHRTMHGVFYDRPKLRQHFARVREKERPRSFSHLVFEITLAERMDFDPP